MKVTYKRLIEEIIPYLMGIDMSVKDNVTEHMQALLYEIQGIQKTHQKKVTLKASNFASTDDRGNLIVTDGNFSFTPDKFIQKEEAIEKFNAETTIELPEYICDTDERGKSIPLFIRQKLAGILFPVEKETNKNAS